MREIYQIWVREFNHETQSPIKRLVRSCNTKANPLIVIDRNPDGSKLGITKYYLVDVIPNSETVWGNQPAMRFEWCDEREAWLVPEWPLASVRREG
jgi:hypothetical protein